MAQMKNIPILKVKSWMGWMDEQKQLPQVLYKKEVLKHFAKVAGKRLRY